MNAVVQNLVPRRVTTSTRRLDIVFMLLAISLGVVHTWAAISSHSMNADGIAYLDIGDAYLSGDWANAINPVWSPLYSWILGFGLIMVNPSMQWEFTLVHLINLGIFLLALFAFADFWGKLGQFRNRAIEDGRITLSDWAWTSLGYGLFIWITLSLINIWAVTPDMLMAIFVLMAASQIVRIRQNASQLSPYILLGIVLGFGYLAKTIMFPLAFLFLGVALLTPGNLHIAIPKTAIATIFFLLISLPYVGLISVSHGRITFGEAGSLTYLRYVNGITYPHWQGEEQSFGSPTHPSRQVFEDPPVYEFSNPISGTYPISYNPAYWYEGAQIKINPGLQGQAFLSNGIYYLDLFFRQHGGLLVGVLVLTLFSSVQIQSLPNIFHRWGLLIISLLSMALYLVVYVEGRYIGVFLLLFWSDLLANIKVQASQVLSKLVKGLSLLMLATILINLSIFNLEGFKRLNPLPNAQVVTNSPSPSWPGAVAEDLWHLGIKPGDQVGVIGYAFDSFWARLAKVQIVAEMFDWQADPFWLGEPAFQEEVLHAFVSSGARAVVAEHVPHYASLSGWHQVEFSNYYIYLLASAD
jgi:hypothetical protein